MPAGSAPGTLQEMELLCSYRHLPGVTSLQLEKMVQHDIGICEEQGGVVAWDHFGDSSAIGALQPLPWDSQHFGMAMGKLSLYCSAGADPGRLDALIDGLLAQARHDLDLAHLSVELDIDAFPAINALLRAGFQLFDTKRTYYCSQFRPDPRMVRFSSSVRPYRNDDHDTVMALAGAVQFPSRFSRDPAFSRSDVDAMYRLWFERLLCGAGAQSMVVVSERAGEVVACGAIDRDELCRYGINRGFYSGGLYAASGKAAGAYIPVMNRLIRDAIARDGEVMTTVSLHNSAACRVIDAFQSYQHVVMRHAMHLSLSGR